MKVFSKMLLVVLAVFILAGCSKKANTTITCTYTQSQSMFTMTQDVDINIQDGTISNAKLVNEVVYADQYIGKYDESALVDTMKSQFSTYKDVNVEPTSTGVIVTINLDTEEFAKLSNMSVDNFKNIKEDDISELKSGLQTSGYTCK